MNTPIAIVIPFFGKIPSYFKLFLASSSKLTAVQFFIVSDIQYSSKLPNNVSFQYSTLQELENLVYKEVGIYPNLSSPYKLCDLKPLYGAIFKDLLSPFQYWGCCDIDQVFSAEYNNVLKELIAQKYDIINTLDTYTHGPFMLFKNTEKINQLYKQSRDYAEVVQSPKHFAFDECGSKYDGLRKLLNTEGFPVYAECGDSFLNLATQEIIALQDFECMTTVINRAYNKGEIKVYNQSNTKEIIHQGAWVEISPIMIKDSKGKKWSAYHWVRDKKRRKFHYPNWTKVPQSYYVTQYGFFDSETPLKNIFQHIYYHLSYWQRALRDYFWFIRKGQFSQIKDYQKRQK